MQSKNSLNKSVVLSFIFHALVISGLVFSSNVNIKSLVSDFTGSDRDQATELIDTQTEEVTVSYVKPEKRTYNKPKALNKVQIESKKNNEPKESEQTIPDVPEDLKVQSKVKTVLAEKNTDDKSESIEPDQDIPDALEGLKAQSKAKTVLAKNDLDKKKELLIKNPNPPQEIDHTVQSNNSDKASQELSGNDSLGSKAKVNMGTLIDGKNDGRRLKQVSGNPKPTYPRFARLNKKQGTVVLKYLVTDTGQVEDIRVLQSSGSKTLDKEAIEKIELWKFKPGQAGETIHPISFKLNGPGKQLPSKLRTKS